MRRKLYAWPLALALVAVSCLDCSLAAQHQQQQHHHPPQQRQRGIVVILLGLRGGDSSPSSNSKSKSRGGGVEHKSPWWLDAKGKWTRSKPNTSLLGDTRSSPSDLSADGFSYDRAWWGEGGGKAKLGAKRKAAVANSPNSSATSTGGVLDASGKLLAAAAVPLLIALAGGGGGGGTATTTSSSTRRKSKSSAPKRAADKKKLKLAVTDKSLPSRAIVAPSKSNASAAVMGKPAQKSSPGKSAGAARLKAAGILISAATVLAVIGELNTSNALISSWEVPFIEPWQALTAGSFFLNMYLLRREGTSTGPGKAPRLFAPAAWAFSIWGAIFLGEIAFVLYQFLPAVVEKSSWWLAKCSPYFGATLSVQSLWIYAFRPWATENGFLWISALLLAIGAISLGNAHRILTLCAMDGDLGFFDVICSYIPIALHFGWLSAAALVNTNGVLAASGATTNAKLSASLLSISFACLVGGFVGFAWRDPIVPIVIAWALTAIADERGYASVVKVIEKSVLERQTSVATMGANVMKLIAGVQVLRVIASAAKGITF